MTQNSKKKTNQKKSIFKNIGFYFVLLYAIITVVTLVQIFILNVIPTKYLIPVVIVLILLLIGMYFLQMGKHMNRLNKILGRILIIILSFILGVGNLYLYKTNSTFGAMTGADTETSVVSVVTMKSSSFDKIEDLENHKVGSITIGDKETQQKALDDLNEDVNVVIRDFDSYDTFADGLYNGEVDAILLNEGSRSAFEDKHPNFDGDTKVIKQYTYKTEAKDLSKNVDVTDEAFNIYITGIDTYGTIATVARTDVNMIVTVNPKSKQILMTSIPRDYYIPQTCQNNQNDKLTHTGIFGVQCTLDSTEKFFGIEMNYYARVNFSSLVEIVDALGGITVNSPFAFTTLHGKYNIVVGDNQMDGAKALGFVRERYALPDGDRERGRNQMRVLTAIIDKATSPAIVTNYASIMDAVGGTFQTNMSQSEMNSLIKMQLSDMSGWNIQQQQVTGAGGTDWTPANGFNAYVMYPDQTSVNTAVTNIKSVLDGNSANVTE